MGNTVKYDMKPPSRYPAPIDWVVTVFYSGMGIVFLWGLLPDNPSEASWKKWAMYAFYGAMPGLCLVGMSIGHICGKWRGAQAFYNSFRNSFHQ
jgi:hypothetical protein